jgi:DNA recombination protein RmuC
MLIGPVQTALLILIAVLVVVLGGVLTLLLRRELTALRGESTGRLSERTQEIDGRLQAIVETMDRRLGELDVKVDRRMENASKQTVEIHERLGKLNEATTQMNDRVKDLARLEQALKPPKARGGFGELLLENLLRDSLPPSHFELQYGFKGGERVDAVIRVERLVPVDAKFPLDNFQRLVEASSESDRLVHEKAFGRDLKAHIDAIAGKYIRPDEGTYDFALMYLPAEAVYYELVCGKTGNLYSYALEKRVFPVSPTTFTAYLQVVALGLKGLQIEKHAHEVMAYCAQLRNDFGRFKEDFDLVGTHIGRAQSKFGDAEKRLDRFGNKLEQATEQGTVETTLDAIAIEEPETQAELNPGSPL